MRRLRVVSAVVGLLVGLLALLLVPNPALDTERRSGDPALAERVAHLAGSGRAIPSLSAVELRAGQLHHAGLGEWAGPDGTPSPERVYELGSVTKAFTGMLLADAVERGEVTLDDRADRWLPALAGSEAGSVTLRELATHTSGVPGTPLPLLGKVVLANWTGANWSDTGTAELLQMVAETPLQGRGQEAYSNAGVAVLGHALAAAGGQPDYPTLLQTRLLDPLGMADTSLVVAPAADDPVTPHRANGWRVDPWWGEGMAPAGSSTRTTAADMARFLEAVVTGRAPGVGALDPITEPAENGQRHGMLWIIEPPDEDSGSVVTWHNGRTGGGSTMLAVDRQAQTGVVLLSDIASGKVDRLALRLLRGSEEPVASSFGTASLAPGVVALLLVLGTWWRRPKHRLALVDLLVEALVGVVLLARFGPWDVVSGWWGAALIGVGAAGAVRQLARHKDLPLHGKRPRWEVVWLGLSLLVALGLLVLALW